MRKKLFSSLMILALIFSLSIPSYVSAKSNAPTIVINGEIMKFTNEPRIEKGTTMVPFRDIFNALGVKVRYDSSTQSITANKDNTTVIVFINQTNATKNGEVVKLDRAPYVDKGVTYVPLRFVSQAYGYVVKYSNNTITINTGSSSAPSNQSSNNASSNSTNNSQGNTNTAANDLSSLAEVLSQQVVHITTYDSRNNVLALGSGVIYTSSGEILTNFHVIEDAAYVVVSTADGKEYKTDRVLQYDEDRDLALLKISATGLKAATLGNSNASKMGDSIITMGSPLGFNNTMSTGIISNISREMFGYEYIQLTAPIDSGSSGGGLFNANGELIGIITAKVESSANINFAIPGKDVRSFVGQARSDYKMPIVSSTGYTNELEETLVALQQLLDENPVIEYDGVEFEFEWYVTYLEDSEQIGILGDMEDYNNYAELLDMQFADQEYDVIGSIVEYVASDIVYEELGIEQLAIGLSVTDTVSFRPPYVSYDGYEVYNGKYYIDYLFAFAYYDRVARELYLTVDPEGSEVIYDL